MKKLIAILVVFAMVATVAFAETSISGSIETRWTIIQGSDADNAPVTTEAKIHAGAIQLTGANDDGTFGGTFKLTYGLGSTGNDITSGFRAERAFVWWQPIPQVKLWIGEDGDGLMNSCGLTRWGHHKMDRGISVENWDDHNFLLGNYDAFGVVVSIMPVDWVTLHIAMTLAAREAGAPYGPIEYYDDSAAEAGLFQNGLQIQAVIAPEGVGKFFITYRQSAAGGGWPIYSDRLGLTYQAASFVDGLQFEIGGNYDLSDGTLVGDNSPFRLGLGALYAIEDFGVKFRMMMQPREVPNGTDWLWFRADLMPYYQFDFGTVFFNIRVASRNADDINWHINPYLRLNVGSGDLRVGLLVEGSSANNTNVTFKLPISMLFAF